MYDGLSLAESNARELELATKENVELGRKLFAADSKIAELLAALESAKKEKEEVELKHEEAIDAVQVQLCNAYVDIECLSMALRSSANLPVQSPRSRRLEDVGSCKEGYVYYLSTSKLMAIDWAKS